MIHPGQCRRRSLRWLRGEAQIVQRVTEPPMGGLIKEHAGCHVATAVLAAGRRTRIRWTALRHRRWWYQVHEEQR